MNILYLGENYLSNILLDFRDKWKINYPLSMDEARDELSNKNWDIIFLVQGFTQDDPVLNIKEIQKIVGFHSPLVFIYKTIEAIDLTMRLSLGLFDYIRNIELDENRLRLYVKKIESNKLSMEGLINLRVAIVDDSQTSLSFTSSILEDMGITGVKTFRNPRLLLESEEIFDIFFIDMVMPDVQGDELAYLIRKNFPRSIIIVMSSLSSVKAIANVLTNGADDYIIKPFNREIFMARLKTNYRPYKLMQLLEEKNIELDRISKTDALTGAYNHGYLIEKLGEEVDKATFSGLPLSLLFIDLDFFKEINDTYGHIQGDNVLMTLSNIFKANCRDKDFFGRFGGEEFIFIMGDTDLDAAKGFVHRLKDIFEDKKIPGIERSVTFSGGLSQWKGESVVDYIKKVDKLLYKAKKNGRNQIVWE